METTFDSKYTGFTDKKYLELVDLNFLLNKLQNNLHEVRGLISDTVEHRSPDIIFTNNHKIEFLIKTIQKTLEKLENV